MDGGSSVPAVEAGDQLTSFFSVMLDVVFGGLVRVARGELRMTVRHERLMRRVSVVVFLIVLGRFAVMVRRQVVLVGRGKMVLFAREHFCHGISDAIIFGAGDCRARKARAVRMQL
jgi:hypothetical protein